jgi:hypothetical protein
MSTELTTVGEPLSIIERAIEKGIDAETMSKLVDLQERIQRNQAESEFNQAMLAFQNDCPLVLHDKNGDQNRYTYASLARIVQTIKPTLAQHGLTFSFDSSTTENEMTIVCTIAHVAGHSRKHAISMQLAGTRAMNQPQMAASALTYGRRHALCAALGIVSADTDDDCQSVPPREQARNPPPRPEPRVAPRSVPSKPVGGLATVNERFQNLKARWKDATVSDGDTPTPDLWRQWVVSHTELPPDAALKPEMWSPADLKTAEDAMLKIEGLPH